VKEDEVSEGEVSIFFATEGMAHSIYQVVLLAHDHPEGFVVREEGIEGDRGVLNDGVIDGIL
jgi:hypothetical protein